VVPENALAVGLVAAAAVDRAAADVDWVRELSTCCVNLAVDVALGVKCRRRSRRQVLSISRRKIIKMFTKTPKKV